MRLTLGQRLRLSRGAVLYSAVDRAAHTLARLRYALPDAQPERHHVALEPNVPYGATRHDHHRLDVYIPMRAPRPAPVVMYVHGGAFASLSKDTHRVMALAIARRGYVVFNINYRMGFRHPFPEPLEDVANALLWVNANADRFRNAPFGELQRRPFGQRQKAINRQTDGPTHPYSIGAQLHIGRRTNRRATCVVPTGGLPETRPRPRGRSGIGYRGRGCRSAPAERIAFRETGSPALPWAVGPVVAIGAAFCIERRSGVPG